VRHLKKVLAKDPNNPDALFWLTATYGHVGKTAAAAPLVERILEIDPFNPINHSLPGWLYFFNGQFELALKPFFTMYQMLPENPANRGLYATVLLYNGRYDEAYALIDQIYEAAPQHLFAQLGMFLKLALQGKKEEALQSLTYQLEYVARRDKTYSWYMAVGYSILGEKNMALDWLGNAVDLGFINYPFLSEIDPFLEKIREEEEFQKLMVLVKSRWEAFEE
jgi:tetratricopeptide (TPR) repeat protein